MQPKTEKQAPAENSTSPRYHHRWPFLPNDNGRFTGPLIYRAVHTPPHEDKPLLHQMQKPYSSEYCNYPVTVALQRMLRDQGAAKLRRQGIIKTFNS